MSTPQKNVRRICVFCASSTKVDGIYSSAAEDLGRIFAENGITTVHGAGAGGLMGSLTKGCLSAGGKVVGVIPQFMVDLEWLHSGLSETIIVDTMHQRKEQMVKNTDAVVALPGGTGTLEELLEVITMKRLGLYFKPIIIVNINGFFNHLLAQFDFMAENKMMKEKHLAMWQVVPTADRVLPAIIDDTGWDRNAREFAVV